jgi:flavin reductase (DIM6/NTAB) family NADH-FMN oxidoreductase RutF
MTLGFAQDSFDPLAYRKALGAFATGVCVVTADTRHGLLGITINSFTSVSLRPPIVLWCLDETSDRWLAFAKADAFAINVLPAYAQNLSERFAHGIAELQPHEVETIDGVPTLPCALARLRCAAGERVQSGDHLVIFGHVTGFDAAAGDALTYFRGRYGRAASPER